MRLQAPEQQGCVCPPEHNGALAWLMDVHFIFYLLSHLLSSRTLSGADGHQYSMYSALWPFFLSLIVSLHENNVVAVWK